GVELFLVPESDWFQREDRVAGLVHRLDCFFEAFRRNDRAEMTVAIDDNPDASCHRDPTNAGDIGVGLSSGGTDANGVGIASNTQVADIDIVAAGGETKTGAIAQRNVAGANRVAIERTYTNGRVVRADDVAIERQFAIAGIGAAT